jgi:tetratricopeptide (TPR) repeat protein
MISVNRLYLLFVIILLSACATSKQSTDLNADKNDSTINYTVSDKFIEAKKNLFQGKTTMAERGFESCIKMNPRHDASYYELARMYENINPNKSIELCKTAINIDPKNIWYHELLLRIYQQQKQYSNAIEVNKDLIEISKNRKEYYYQLANLYIRNEEYKQAINIYEQIITKFGYEDGVMSQIKQIYLKQGNYNKAAETLEEMIKHQPNNKDYYGMLAEIYSKEGRNDKAFTYYQKILEIDPKDGFVHFALADYYRSINDINKAIEELKLGMASPNLDVNSKMKVLLGMLEVSKTDTGFTSSFEELLDIAYSTNPNEPKIIALKADYANGKGNYNDAVKFYRQVLSLDSSKYVIWSQLLSTEEKLANYIAIKDESERALHIFPQQPDLYYYNAIALIKEGNWKKAKERISMGSNFVYNMDQKALFLALQAKAELQLGEKDNGKANFERAISMTPNNSEFKKDYAFALASHNLELNLALKYSQEALELNIDNPDYIYVYTYCLFKNGEVTEALKWLKPALKKFPENTNLQLLDMEINKNE